MDVSIKKKNNHTGANSSHSDAFTETEDKHVLNKLDILMLNNGWNDKNEKLIIEIAYNSGIYKRLHKQSSQYYKSINKIINLSLLILSIFLTTDSILDLLRDDILELVQKIIVFTVTLLSLINNFLKYGELSEQHLQASNKFNTIYNNIRNTMCIYRKDRYNASKYIKGVLKDYDQLEIESPDIPQLFITLIERKINSDVKYENINMPTDPFAEIDVVTEDEEHGNLVQMKSIKKKKNDTTSNRKFKINNMQNISEIYDCVKIDGEISENDNITMIDLQNHRKNALDLETQYEFNRFMQQ